MDQDQTSSKDSSSGKNQPSPLPVPKTSELKILNSKILALTMDKETAIAEENFSEAARVTKILQALYKEKENF